MRGPNETRTQRARILRRQDNGAEARLWHALRNRQMCGFKFARQLPIGPYFADFACRELMVVVEADGSQHMDLPNDQIRNMYMNELGWSVARFWASDVLSSYEAVLETIAGICDGRISEFVNARDFQFYPAIPKNMTSKEAPHPSPLPVNGKRESIVAAPSHFMRRAIGLARPGKTWPNPSVGCVLVRDGRIVGEGTTGDGGRPHAEEVALDAAGDNAKSATAYVTLEPCGQRSTPRPSCSERLLAAGVVKVVYACDDPSPLASHLGPQRLKDAGITVEGGLLAEEASHLIAPFAHFLKTGRPMVQIATSPDAFDAEFIADPGADLDAELRAAAAKGYRSLYVVEGTQLASELRALGLLTE